MKPEILYTPDLSHPKLVSMVVVDPDCPNFQRMQKGNELFFTKEDAIAKALEIQEANVAPENVKIILEADDFYPSNPYQDWDTLGSLWLSPKCHYQGSNDEAPDHIWEISRESAVKWLEDNLDILWFSPVYMYNHSGIAFSLSPFSCNWDSGQVGWLVVTKESQETMGTPIDRIEEVAKAEFQEFDDVIQGNVYYFRIEDAEGNEIDSCGGFIGDGGLEDIPSNVPCEYREVVKAKILKEYPWVKFEEEE